MSSTQSAPAESFPQYSSSTHFFRRALIMALLLVLYTVLSILFAQVLDDHEAHAHIAYLPLVLAGLWWSHRGIVVAGILISILLTFKVTGLTHCSWWTESEMILSMVVVSSFFGLVGARMRRAQHALWASRQRYQQLIENSLAGILVYRDETVLFANSRLAAMLRCQAEELVGQPVMDLIAPDDRQEVLDRLRKREESGITDLHYETRLIRADGVEVWTDVFSNRTTIDGETSVLVNLYDVTAKRELETLAREREEQLVHSVRLAELGELAASVAHEVNQPLTGIRNYARNAVYMIENDVGEREDLAGNLDRIVGQVDRAAHIIQRMQQLSRRSDRKLEPVDVNRSVGEAIELLSPQLRLAGVKVTVDLDDTLPQLKGDRIRIEQVFLNLLNNALHALEEVSLRELSIRSFRDSGGMVVVEFNDTGTGFSEETRKKLFKPFYSTHTNGKGTGLGLSISLGVVESHHGRIEATGEPGRGARFTVRLPLSQENNEEESMGAQG